MLVQQWYISTDIISSCEKDMDAIFVCHSLTARVHAGGALRNLSQPSQASQAYENVKKDTRRKLLKSAVQLFPLLTEVGGLPGSSISIDS